MIRRLLYRLYRFGYAIKDRLFRRFTPAGLLVLASLAVSSVFGLDTNRTMAFQAFTFLLVLVAAAFVRSLFFRGRFQVRRVLPRFATVGEPFTYRIFVENETPAIHSGLSAVEDTGDARPTLEELTRVSEPWERELNVVDRFFGYYRWMYLVSRKRQALVREVPLPLLPPGGRIDLPAELRPVRRGPMRLNRLLISKTDPFGLCRSIVPADSPGMVTVLPKRYPVPDLNLPGNRHYQPGGVALASSVGDSEEFVSLRDYRPGDPIRRIHWKSLARMDKPIVKEHQDEFFVRHALILDTFQKTGSAEIFEEAVSVASSFACTVLTQESLLDLMFVGTKAYCFTSGRGLSHTDAMMEILASVTVCRDKPFGALPPMVFRRAGLLSACICVFIDWDDEREAFVRKLRGRGLPLKALVVTESAGPMDDKPEGFHWLEIGRIGEGLAGI